MQNQRERTLMRPRKALAIGAAVLLAGSLTQTVAFASHSEESLAGSNFEIDTDANLKVDDASPSIDWASVTEQRKADTLSGSTDESFGQGTKEDTAAPVVVDGSIPPNKSDLKSFGIFQEGSGGTGFLNLYWTRVQDPSGTTNMDFEFNKRQCTVGATPADTDCTANGITPIRSTGDLLITYDLSKGGTHPVLSLREWTAAGVWGTETNLTDSLKATGSINTSAIPTGDSDGLGALSARTFGEAQLDLTAIFDTTDCQSFGSAYLKSRSSDSFTAALKDFVPPVPVNITNCASLTVTKSGSDNGSQAGAVFTLYNGSNTSGTVVDTCTVNSAGACLWTNGTVATGDDTATKQNLSVGTYTIDETTVPSGYTKDSDLPETFTLTAGQAKTLTYVNTANPGSLSVTKDDDASDPVAGAVFTLYNGTGTGGTVVDTCTTDAAGDCFWTNGADPDTSSKTGLPAGTYTIDETTVPTGYTKDSDLPETFTISNGQSKSLNYTNVRKFKVIVLVCQESDGSLYPSDVTIDGTAVTDSASASDIGTLDEGDLCGITAGSKGGLGTGNHKADPISIPTSQP